MWRIGALVAVLVLVGPSLPSKLPGLAEVGAALASAKPWLLVLAVLAEAVSLRPPRSCSSTAWSRAGW